MNSVAAGAVYVAIVFAAGFGLGILRVLVTAPAIGAFRATALEIPVILVVSWIVSGWCTSRFHVPPRAAPRLVMGLSAFALLMAAEALLSVWVFGRSLASHLAALREPAALLGLAGQAAFAAVPVLRAWMPGTRAKP